jgi:hypothetical protein
MANARSLSPENVADVLTFLSWQQPLLGTTPADRTGNSVEAGRTLILDWLAASLRSEDEVAHG